MYALNMTRRVITAKVTPQIALTVEKDWMLVEKKPPLGFCLNAAPSQKDVQFEQNSFPLKFSQMARCNSFHGFHHVIVNHSVMTGLLIISTS